jgi:[ribosomal protein S18]-alanine N-acetyltransferase
MSEKDATSKKPEVRVHIRWMIRRDVPEVLAIENKRFEFPWSEEDFVRSLRQRNCIGMVALHNDKVLGYMVYEMHKNRMHLLNIAVDPDYARRGVGTQLIEELVAKLLQQRRARLTFDVRETNLPAQLFLRDCGLKAVNTLPKFYKDTDEAAYQMRFLARSEEETAAHALERLEKLTGIGWEIGEWNGLDEYQARPLSMGNRVGLNTVLRSRAAVKDPVAAYKEVNRLLKTDALIEQGEWRRSRPEPVTIPLDSISPVRINRGKDGELARAFEAADAKWQSQISDEKTARDTTRGIS